MLDFQTVNVSSTEDLHSVQRHDHQIPIIFQKLAPLDSQVNTYWFSAYRQEVSLLNNGLLGVLVATIPGSARSHSLGFPGAATGKGLPCCSPPSLPCGWLLAILGTWDPGNTGKAAPGTYLFSLSCHPWAPTWPWLCSFYTGLQFQ